jgi:hypothetical protein
MPKNQHLDGATAAVPLCGSSASTGATLDAESAIELPAADSRAKKNTLPLTESSVP